jgi:hypothetical protein
MGDPAGEDLSVGIPQLSRRASLGTIGPSEIALMGIVPSAALRAPPWAELCTAVPNGQGICHIIGKQPDDRDCLKNSYF